MSALKFVLDIDAEFIPGAGKILDAGLESSSCIYDVKVSANDWAQTWRPRAPK
jgi:hypothetical protein